MYLVKVDNPQTDNDKKISGTIKINKTGPKRQATGELSGFPGGGTIGPITGDLTFSQENVVVDEMIVRLQNEIETKFSVKLKLKYESDGSQSQTNQSAAVTASQSTASQSTSTTTSPENRVDPPLSASASNAKIVDPKSISSKITISKKSGPGEIKGIVEKELTEGVAEFDGIQFDKAGSYVIEVIPSNPDLERTEFTILVDEEPEQIEQTKEPQEDQKPTGTRPIIAQIDQPNVKLRPIERDITNSATETVEAAETMGLKPLLYYNGGEIAKNTQIKNLSLYYEDNLPKCKVTFKDEKSFLKDNPPRDDTKFEVFLSSADKDIKYIHMAFKIKNHRQLDKSATWYFEGIVDIDDLFVPSSKSYNGTSFDALKSIARKLNIGFNSNIENTQDEMKWLNTNKEYKDFIKDIIAHSYITDKSFMYGYIDYYYCFNYVDIEKEWARDISGDMMVETGNNSKLAKGSNEKKFIPLILTNEPSQKSSSGFFYDHKIINQSTETSLENGYRTVVRYYDEQTKSILEFEVDSQGTDNNRMISLKGETGTNQFADKKVEKKYLGKFDSENLHKNYLYAETQNRINLNALTKIACTLKLPNCNYNLYKLQKVQVIFYNQSQNVGQPYLQDFKHSGEWIIIDIAFEYNVGKNGAKLEQVLTLARKELGKNPEEMKEGNAPPAEKKEGNKNENPEQPKTEKPNQKYKVGQKVKLVKTDGSIYEVEITKILENGVDVEGKLTYLGTNKSQPNSAPQSTISKETITTEGESKSSSKKLEEDQQNTTAPANNQNVSNASKLRSTLSQLGYKEKGTEIDNGGKDISENIEKAVSSLLKTIKQELPNIKVTITGGNDKYHQGLSYKSRHSAGNAVDLVVSPSDTNTLDKVVAILHRYAAGNSPNFRFIDEYRHLTKAGTGNHFHISWGPGTESQAELNTALALAQQGKIDPIKIS